MTLPPASCVIWIIRPSTWSGTPATIAVGGLPSRSGQLRRTSSWLAPMPPEVTNTACASSENSPTTSRELGAPRTRAARLEHRPAHAGHRAAGDHQLVDLVAEAQLDQPARGRLAHAALERLDHARPGAPREVEARHRVAVPDRQVAAALRPADVGHELHAHPGQPRALLAGGEVDVGLGPAPRPLVLVAVEARGAEPVLPGELVRVLDPQPALLGAVDEHQPAQGPERLAAQRGLRLLVEEDDLAAGVGQLRGGDEAREPRSDDDGVRVHRGVVPDRAR